MFTVLLAGDLIATSPFYFTTRAIVAALLSKQAEGSEAWQGDIKVTSELETDVTELFID